jgi:MFS family permease
MLLRLKYRGKPVREATTRSSLLTDARYGMAYAARQPMVLWPLVMVAVVGALGMPLITSLAALWMKNVLFVGATTYTVVAWIWGMGSLGASVYLASRRDIAWKGKIFIVSSIMFGASLILFGFTRSVPLAAASWFVNGICSSANNITSLAIIQGVIPNEVRGRVMGLLTLSRSLSMMAAAPLGVVAQLTSMAVMVPSMAVLCTVIVTGMAVLIPTLRRLDEEEEKPVPAVAS